MRSKIVTAYYNASYRGNTDLLAVLDFLIAEYDSSFLDHVKRQVKAGRCGVDA